MARSSHHCVCRRAFSSCDNPTASGVGQERDPSCGVQVRTKLTSSASLQPKNLLESESSTMPSFPIRPAILGNQQLLTQRTCGTTHESNPTANRSTVPLQGHSPA